jgi:hypothetical protein
MAQSSALEVVCAYQDAWTRKDFATAARYLAEDFEFHGPRQHLASAKELISVLTAASGRINPRWDMIASTTEADNVLILYNLFLLDGTPAPCADYFTLKMGKIRRETLVFDPRQFPVT